MISTGRTFRATEAVATLFRNLLQDQFPAHAFSLLVLPYVEREAVFCYEIRIDSPNCPEDVRKFIDDYLARLFPAQCQGNSKPGLS